MGVFDDVEAKVFTFYKVTLRFRSKLLGGAPKHPNNIKQWLMAGAGIDQNLELARVVMRTMVENGYFADKDITTAQVMHIMQHEPDKMYELIEQAADELADLMHTNGFKHDENGLFIEDRQVKAMLKENTNILFAGRGKWGKTGKGPLNFVSERAFVEPERIYLGVDAPSGVEQIQGRVSDKNGPRSIVTLYEYVDQPVIQFWVKMTRDELEQEKWAMIFKHAESNGLGAVRSQSFGKFETIGFELDEDPPQFSNGSVLGGPRHPTLGGSELSEAS